MLRMISWVFLAVFLGFAAKAEEVKLAVASNFAPLMAELISDFKAQHAGVDIILISGSSGKLYAQIKHGAPYDLFLSADQAKPARLVDEGLALADSRFTYAIGQVVLWSRDPSLIEAGDELLVTGAFDKLALANSKLAPYGQAAEEVLGKLGILQSSRHKWVQGENIAQTYQFVATGNASLGFVAKSQIWREGQLSHGSVWLIPDDWYQPIRQDAVLLKRAEHKKQAAALLDFLKKKEVRAKIASFGYQPLDTESTDIQDREE